MYSPVAWPSERASDSRSALKEIASANNWFFWPTDLAMTRRGSLIISAAFNSEANALSRTFDLLDAVVEGVAVNSTMQDGPTPARAAKESGVRALCASSTITIGRRNF